MKRFFICISLFLLALSCADAVPEIEDSRAFMSWVENNVPYPGVCYEEEKEGNVLLGFIVDKEGYLRNARILRSSGVNAFDRAAVRTVAKSPRWKPVMADSVAVCAPFVVQVSFRLH